MAANSYKKAGKADKGLKLLLDKGRQKLAGTTGGKHAD